MQRTFSIYIENTFSSAYAHALATASPSSSSPLPLIRQKPLPLFDRNLRLASMLFLDIEDTFYISAETSPLIRQKPASREHALS